MSNISRRQFLKSAGIAALAAGVLAGCGKIPGTDVPDVPEVTSVDLRVIFVGFAGDPIGNSVNGVYDTKVLKGEKKYDPTLIPADKLPKGYVLYSTDKVDIISDSTPMIAKVVVKPDYKDTMRVKINVQFMYGEKGDTSPRVFYAEVKRDTKYLEYKDIAKQFESAAEFKDVYVPDFNADQWFSAIKDNGNGYEATEMPLMVKFKA